MICTHWIGAEGRYCRAQGARRFVNSVACPLHTPAALAGKPEAPETSSLPASALPESPLTASRVADVKAIASGKRRSSPAAYREAQATLADWKETHQS